MLVTGRVYRLRIIMPQMIPSAGRGSAGEMTESFFDRPILNSPYEVPRFHHALDQDGQPLDLPPERTRPPGGSTNDS